MASKESHAEDDDDFVGDADNWDGEDNEIVEEDIPVKQSLHRQRDWRDMERYKEERELKRLMQDDYLFEDDRRSGH